MTALVCSLLLLTFPFTIQDTTRLRDVKTIYVESLGESEGAKLIKEKLENRIAMSKTFALAESREQADAVITGIAKITSSESGSITGTPSVVTGGYGTMYGATLVVRLVDKQKRIIWAGEAIPKRGSDSASSSVTERIMKELVKAYDKDRKRKD